MEEVCAWEMGWTGMDETRGASAGSQGATALSFAWKKKNGGRAGPYQKPSNCCSLSALCRVANKASQEKGRETVPTRANNSMYQNYPQSIRPRSASNEADGGQPLLVSASGGDVLLVAVLCSAQRATRQWQKQGDGATGSQKRAGGNDEKICRYRWLSRSPIG